MQHNNKHLDLAILKRKQQLLHAEESEVLTWREALDEEVAVAAEERHEAEEIFKKKKTIHITKKNERAKVNKQYMCIHKASTLTTKQITHVAKAGNSSIGKRSKHLEEASRLGEEAQQALSIYGQIAEDPGQRKREVS